MVYRKKQKKRTPLPQAGPKAKASKDLWNEKIDEVQLLEMIETLKGKMSQLVKEKGLGHQSVVEISQQLDEYIVQFQRMIRK
ncbi:aspartyl-phosphate phosphatase Spo0E family protein [Brevibacillus composti]|uniref:Aspartyl-phosphate phosphatase Spo0E family protein n=2 Tax=Brevibacillus composti TaxID=2796470 RepID=A0A7T5EQ21_9BACL|nr:aspartyl-phosphate phosphatase Spo0E family protein [Brevibacillus composti]QUO43741.1 aspartyl-phosphate phosphatase Spo0E family protein [Brevibacillus composti]